MNNQFLAFCLAGGEAFDGDPLFVMAGDIEIVDAETPSALEYVATFDLLNASSSGAYDTTNKILYVPSYSGAALYVIDATYPTMPSLLATYTTNMSGAAEIALDVTGEIAYVLCSGTTDYLVSLDISDPTNISELDQLSSANMDAPNGIALDLTNDVAYVTASVGDSITSFNIATPGTLVELDSLTNTNLNGACCVALDIVGEYAYIGTFAGYLVSIDITTPGALSEADTITTHGGYGVHVDLTNDIAYCAKSSSLYSANIANPAAMVGLDSVAGPGASNMVCLTVDLTNEVAYSSCMNADEVYSFNIATPSSLAVLDELADISASGLVIGW